GCKVSNRTTARSGESCLATLPRNSVSCLSDGYKRLSPALQRGLPLGGSPSSRHARRTNLYVLRCDKRHIDSSCGRAHPSRFAILSNDTKLWRPQYPRAGFLFFLP